jgi:hypothetical protein
MSASSILVFTCYASRSTQVLLLVWIFIFKEFNVSLLDLKSCVQASGSISQAFLKVVNCGFEIIILVLFTKIVGFIFR